MVDYARWWPQLRWRHSSGTGSSVSRFAVRLWHGSITRWSHDTGRWSRLDIIAESDTKGCLSSVTFSDHCLLSAVLKTTTTLSSKQTYVYRDLIRLDLAASVIIWQVRPPWYHLRLIPMSSLSYSIVSYRLPSTSSRWQNVARFALEPTTVDGFRLPPSTRNENIGDLNDGRRDQVCHHSMK